LHAYRAWPFLSDPRHVLLSALWAVLMHGTLSVLVLVPILRRSESPVRYGALAAMLGVALDLDHALAAQSLKPHALEQLPERPATHSLLAAAMLAVLAWTLLESPLVGWCVLAVLVAHLLPDAAGGSEPWLYPFSSVDSIPWLACPVGLAALFGASRLLAGRALPRARLGGA
jgi:membrane-bound metal-dependent hydrolase YbcI (DUF457 family)